MCLRLRCRRKKRDPRRQTAGRKGARGGRTETGRHRQSSPKENIEDLQKELDSYVGLSAVKREVKDLINLAAVERLRRQHGLPTADMSLHMVFSGNPGTGKDHYRPADGPGLPQPGHLVQGAAGGGRPQQGWWRATWDRQPSRPGRSSTPLWGGCAVHRRGIRPQRRRGQRLRPGGHRHAAEGHGGPPGRPGGDRRGLRRADGRVHPLQSGTGVQVQPLPPLCRLHGGGTAGHLPDAV